MKIDLYDGRDGLVFLEQLGMVPNRRTQHSSVPSPSRFRSGAGAAAMSGAAVDAGQSRSGSSRPVEMRRRNHLTNASNVLKPSWTRRTGEESAEESAPQESRPRRDDSRGRQNEPRGGRDRQHAAGSRLRRSIRTTSKPLRWKPRPAPKPLIQPKRSPVMARMPRAKRAARAVAGAVAVAAVAAETASRARASRKPPPTGTRVERSDNGNSTSAKRRMRKQQTSRTNPAKSSQKTFRSPHSMIVRESTKRPSGKRELKANASGVHPMRPPKGEKIRQMRRHPRSRAPAARRARSRQEAATVKAEDEVSPSKSAAASAPAPEPTPEPAIVRTGSTDRHLIEDEPVFSPPARRPRTIRDLDSIPGRLRLIAVRD